MPGLLDRIASLKDEELLEGVRLLSASDTDDIRFVREAMVMEYERRHGDGSFENSIHGAMPN